MCVALVARMTMTYSNSFWMQSNEEMRIQWIFKQNVNELKTPYFLSQCSELRRVGAKNAKVCLQSWVDEVLSTFIVAPPASTLVILSHMSFSNDDIIWKKTPFSCYNCMYCVELQQRASFASSSRRSFAVVGGKLRLSPLSSSRHNLRGRSFTPSRSWQRRRKKLEPFTSSNLELQLVEFSGIRKTREHAESRPPNFINDLIRSLLLFRSLTVFKVHHFWISFCAKWTIKLEF